MNDCRFLSIACLSMIVFSSSSCDKIEKVELDRSKEIILSHSKNICVFLPHDSTFIHQKGIDSEGGESRSAIDDSAIYYYVGMYPYDPTVVKKKQEVSKTESGLPLYRYKNQLNKPELQVEFEKHAEYSVYVELSFENPSGQNEVMALDILKTVHRCPK